MVMCHNIRNMAQMCVLLLYTYLLLLLSCLITPSAHRLRIYGNFTEPALNPQATRHWVKAPGPKILPRGSTRFTGYRGDCIDSNL